MKKTMGHRAMRRMAGDVRGIAAVEFAIIAPALFLLIMGGIEFGFMMFNQARLGGTLSQAARMATTGDTTTNGVNGANIDTMVTQNLTFVNGAKVDIVKSFYDKFDQVHQPEVKNTSSTNPPYCWTDVNGNQKWDADPSRDGLGGANDIVNYKVQVTYPALFPLVTKAVNGTGSIVLSGQRTLQNEPFQAGSDMAPKQCCISAAAGNPVTCAAS